MWAHPDEVRRAAEILAAAERPAVIAGTSLRWSTDPAGLRALADILHAPVYLNSLARWALPPDHPSFLALSRRKALEDADVVLDFGAPFDFRLGYGQAPAIAADARVIMADDARGKTGHKRARDVGLGGEIGGTLRQRA